MSSEPPREAAARLDDEVAALPLDDVCAGACSETLRSLGARAADLAREARAEGEDEAAALAEACGACLGHLGDGLIAPAETWPMVVSGVHALRQALAGEIAGAAVDAARYELETLLPAPDVRPDTLCR